MPPKTRGKDMNATYSPQDAAEQAREAFRKGAEQFEKLSLDTTVPESVRALAEKTVTQTREAYEKGKDALEDRKSTRLNSSHSAKSRMPSSA